MGADKKVQKAGEGSQQIQVGTLNITQGITEERARAVYAEMSQKAMADCTAEAVKTAQARIEEFESVFIPRFQQIEGDFASFSDPAFQMLLRKAQLTAACSGSEKGYKVLSELLVHRAKNRENIKKKASITKAVEIIDMVDDDSLLGLTVFHSVKQFTPTSGVVKDGLAVLDSLYGRYDLDLLPTDYLWLDNLEVVGAVTVNSIGSMKKYDEYFSEKLSGYVCAGIKKNSAEHEQARALLKESGLHEALLVENKLLDDYLRVQIPNLNNIERVNFSYAINPLSVEPIRASYSIVFNEKQKQAVKAIIALYDNNHSTINNVKKNFTAFLSLFPSIKKVMDWWDALVPVIELTAIGRVIAQTNAKSIDPTLPDID